MRIILIWRRRKYRKARKCQEKSYIIFRYFKLNKCLVFDIKSCIMFICSRGTRKEGNDQPHERDRNTPNASAIKGTPRPLTLGLAKTQCRQGDIQLTKGSRVCEANYLTIFRTKQGLTTKGEEYCLGRIVSATG